MSEAKTALAAFPGSVSGGESEDVGIGCDWERRDCAWEAGG